MKKVLVLLTILVVFISACAKSTVQQVKDDASGSVGTTVSVAGGGSFTRISPEELAKMLENKDFFFVNVHIPYEGEIKGTDAFIPYDQTLSLLTQYPAKTDKIVLYCRSGRMSTMAAEDLVKSGYTNVYELNGGMVAWETAGFELIKK